MTCPEVDAIEDGLDLAHPARVRHVGVIVYGGDAGTRVGVTVVRACPVSVQSNLGGKKIGFLISELKM